MDRDGLIFWIEQHDLQQAPGGVSADHQHTVIALADEAQRNGDRGPDVLAGDLVTPSALRNVMTIKQTPFMRAARFAGDLENPFYEEERHRDVWNEASAFGLQLALVTALSFATLGIWIVGRPALTYVQIGLALTGAVGGLTIVYAQRLGVDVLAPQRLQRARMIPLAVLVVMLVAGVLHADATSWSWSTAVGAVTGILVAAGAVVLARRLSQVEHPLD